MVFDGEDHGYGTNCANLSYRALTTAFRLAVEKKCHGKVKESLFIIGNRTLGCEIEKRRLENIMDKYID